MRSGGRAGVVALLVLTAAAACGGDDDDAVTRVDDDVSVTEDNLQELEAQAATAPRCDDLFASGAVLPAEMPDFCKDATDAMLAVVFFDCADGRNLFQVETTAGPAWALSEDTVRVVPVLEEDAVYISAYEECTGE
ncbi:MAG: hypothetical protein ACRDV7_03390 [Acidimicrobiia bacterium]